MNRSSAPVSSGHRQRSAVELGALAVGAVFLLVGVAGFIPGITQDYGQMEFAGPGSEAELLGLFQVSILHNAVHLLFGIGGLAAAATVAGARAFLIGGGLVYGVLWIYGTLVDQSSDANFVPVNTADNWLHFGLTVGMILLGVVLGMGRARATGGTTGRAPDRPEATA